VSLASRPTVVLVTDYTDGAPRVSIARYHRSPATGGDVPPDVVPAMCVFGGMEHSDIQAVTVRA